jgi:hypothetical protein
LRKSTKHWGFSKKTGESKVFVVEERKYTAIRWLISIQNFAGIPQCNKTATLEIIDSIICTVFWISTIHNIFAFLTDNNHLHCSQFSTSCHLCVQEVPQAIVNSKPNRKALQEQRLASFFRKGQDGSVLELLNWTVSVALLSSA